jgi:hypothetical protein
MARNQYERKTFMQEIATFTNDLIQTIKIAAVDGDSNRLDELNFVAPPAKIIGNCPKCSKDLALKSWEGQFYAKCTNTNKCKIAYNTDSEGNPSGGTCNQEGCNGPVNVTRKGSRICVKCETWQDPFVATVIGECMKCDSPLHLRTYGKRHVATCSKEKDPECRTAYDCDKDGKPKKKCQDKSCGGPIYTTKSKSMVCAKCGKWQDDGKKKA